MPEAAVAPAPAAASSPAPAAPVSSPAPASPAPVAPAPAPAAPQQTWGSGGVTTTVDPNKFPIRDDFAREVLKEKLAAIPAVADEPVVEEPAIAEPVEAVAAPEVPAPDAVEEPKPVEAAEPEFDFDPPAIVTPEALTQMVTDNPEFGKLLEADSRLKGQLYKTAREAAELKPYREIFPDLDSAKSAVEAATQFNDVRNVFMGSETLEGTQAALARMMELSYERDENGQVLMENGQPVVGEDFWGFVDNTVKLGMQDELSSHREAVESRFKKNEYHLSAKTQEEANTAYAVDAALLGFMDELAGVVVETPEAELPEHLKRKAEELNEREKALNQKQHGETVQKRQTFESGMQVEAQTRLNSGIGKILENVEKQGGVISPYLKNVLPRAIGAKVVAKIQANPALQSQMQALQRLPIGDESKTRRLAAIDRAYQMYLGDVAREELREAGVQISNASKAKADKVTAQANATKQSEIKGSRGVSSGTAPMAAAAAFDAAQAEWTKANPTKPFDKSAKELILPRVLQLMGAR